MWETQLRTTSAALALGMIVAATPAIAACDEDSIETVSSDGDLIALSSGQEYDVAGGDEATAAAWAEGDDVLMCGDTMIDKDENGERIDVTPH